MSRPKVGLLYSEIFKSHKPNCEHPDVPERLDSIYKSLRESEYFENLRLISARKPKRGLLNKLHSKNYIEKLKRVSKKAKNGVIWLDPDTYISAETYNTIQYVLGGIEETVDYLFSGGKYAFAAVRPPGHHAHYDSGSGFCLVNNAAYAALYAMENYQLSRIFILDWDLHHGNGTQSIFYTNKNVFYLSIHQSGIYPHTGSKTEIGEGEGRGFTKNIPFEFGIDNKSYLNLFNKEVVPACQTFDPQLIIISAGFDTHKNESMSHSNITSHLYKAITSQLVSEFPHTPILSVLEGGYNTDILGKHVLSHISGFIDNSLLSSH